MKWTSADWALLRLALTIGGVITLIGWLVTLLGCGGYPIENASPVTFCPSKIVLPIPAPTNTSPDFGTTLCWTNVPAFRMNVVPAGFASTAA